MNQAFLFTLVTNVLGLVVKALSPELKSWLESIVKSLQAQAAKSGNEWDTIFANLITEVFQLPSA